VLTYHASQQEATGFAAECKCAGLKLIAGRDKQADDIAAIATVCEAFDGIPEKANPIGIATRDGLTRRNGYRRDRVAKYQSNLFYG
jgi:hypothetical protein